MPIKFRCVHCRQLLGISRGKAGQPVDCPSCGRTVRVPNLDGRVDPVTAPALDLQDSALAKALDQLAMIGQLPDDELLFDEAPPDEPPPAAVSSAPPVAAPRPVAAVAPLPAQIVEPKPVPLPAAADLGDLARIAGPSASPAPHVWSSPPSARSALVGMAVISLAALALGFTAGYITGRGTSGPIAASAPQPEPVANPNPAPAAATAPKPALRGRISYRTESGESRPDTGARVIVLPEKRSGESRLSVPGFRAADSAADFQAGAAALRALGGDVAIVGEDGQFEIALPAAGTYHILVLSRFQPQVGDAQPEPGLRALLDAWFTRPDQLLGRVRHHLGQVKYTGEEARMWDHSFEKAG